MIEAAVAAHITDADLGLTYDPDGADGNMSIEAMASTPDLFATVLSWGANPIDGGSALHGYDEPTVQIAVRGPQHGARDAHDTAQAVWGLLVGLTSTTLADGTDDETYVVLVKADQSAPSRLGPPDQNHRTTYAMNLAFHILNPTLNRV